MAAEPVKYNCECIACGHKLESEEHCANIKCPKCGGQMRRAERPGPGQPAPEAQSSSKALTDWTRSRLARGLAAGADGVDRDENVIRGFSVVSRGEALGHDLWLDDEFLAQVVTAGNSTAHGLKSRFTHPGLCSDGLGKYLGRAHNLRLDGDQVRADLHLAEVAERAPDGNLAGYVLDLAEEDPDAFGTSIVFSHDIDAEQAFVDAHDTENGRFFSPDSDNADNLPHARLAHLHAVDAVDEPAANSGMFGAPEFGAVAANADRFLDWALGLSELLPADVELGLGVESERARDYLTNYLDRRGLAVIPQTVTDVKEIPMAEKTVDQVQKISTEDLDAAKRETEQAERDRFARLRAKFGERPQFVIDQYSAGHDVAEAETALKDVLLVEKDAEIEALKKAPAQPADDADGADGAGAEGIAFGEGGDGAPDDFMSRARTRAKADGTTLDEAVFAEAGENPKTADDYVNARFPRR